jgi:hypothetical protein
VDAGLTWLLTELGTVGPPLLHMRSPTAATRISATQAVFT